MKKRIYTAAGLFLAAALVFGGCGKEKVPESEFATADEAKEALTSAETIEIYFDLYGSKRKTKIVADGKVAGYLQKNTVYINEEEWFSIDYVEDEPINDREGSGTTYGYYDASGTCLGYAQERVTTPDQMPEAYYIIFLDADLNEKPYYASEDGHTIYTEGGTVIGSAKKEMDWSGSQCNLYVNLEDNGTQVMDFQDKYALLDMMYDEANEYYKDNK